MSEIPPTENQWFYENKGRRQGGVDEATIISMIKSGELRYGDIVWQKGFSDWQKLENTRLRAHLESTSPPPIPGQHINNTIIWILAFAPILGLLLEASLYEAVYIINKDAVAGWQFLYITLALNILLSVLDERNLQKTGNDTERFKIWVWLAPVYIYQRAKHLQHNLTYFITWIICFILMILIGGNEDEIIANSSLQGKQIIEQRAFNEEIKKSIEGKTLKEILAEPIELKN